MLTLILVIIAAILVVLGLICSPVLLLVGIDAIIVVAVVKGIIKLFTRKKKSKKN